MLVEHQMGFRELHLSIIVHSTRLRTTSSSPSSKLLHRLLDNLLKIQRLQRQKLVPIRHDPLIDEITSIPVGEKPSLDQSPHSLAVLVLPPGLLRLLYHRSGVEVRDLVLRPLQLLQQRNDIVLRR
jgi:hypothetical protein